MATHFNVLAWKIPWTEEPGRLQSLGLQRIGHSWRRYTERVPLCSLRAHIISTQRQLSSSVLCSVLVATRETQEKLFKIPLIRIPHSRPGWRTQRANLPVTGAILRKSFVIQKKKSKPNPTKPQRFTSTHLTFLYSFQLLERKEVY